MSKVVIENRFCGHAGYHRKHGYTRGYLETLRGYICNGWKVGRKEEERPKPYLKEK